MQLEDRKKLNQELRFLDDEKQRIQDLINTLPSIEKRRNEVILKLYPHHDKKH